MAQVDTGQWFILEAGLLIRPDADPRLLRKIPFEFDEKITESENRTSTFLLLQRQWQDF